MVRSVLNLSLINYDSDEPISIYLRTRGRPLQTFVEALDQMSDSCGGDLTLAGVLVTGSARELLSKALEIPAINEITAHAVGANKVNPEIRTIIEIGGQDSKIHTNRAFSGQRDSPSPCFQNERNMRGRHRGFS